MDTRICTPNGARALHELHPGDLVHTEDNGATPLKWVGAQKWVGARQGAGFGKAAPILFEVGAIGNDAPLRLSPQHRVLIAHPYAELGFGNSEVLVPAKALINGHSVRVAPCARITWMNVLCEDHNIIRAENAPVETLLLGDVAREIIEDSQSDAASYPALGGLEGFSQIAVRPVLSVREARGLLSLLQMVPHVATIPAPTQTLF